MARARIVLTIDTDLPRIHAVLERLALVRAGGDVGSTADIVLAEKQLICIQTGEYTFPKWDGLDQVTHDRRRPSRSRRSLGRCW